MSECLYQGTFNPIHNAHLKIAEHVYKTFNFEKIVFIPAFKPPHKNSKDFNMQNAINRLEMVQLAVEDIDYLDVSAIEYTRNTPSYTYDTIVQIYEIVQPKDKINFIIGSDAFLQIESWYKTDELKKLLNFILFSRDNTSNICEFENLRKKGYNYTLMKMPFIDISSSKIRQRCKENKSIDDLVPEKVAEYIKKNGLYKV